MERKNSESNLYLTGFMGSGKSSVGKILATLLDREFVDTDLEIERKTGMSIPELFVREGEKTFRSLEAKIVEEVTQRNGVVVALGGGTFMDPENRKKLLQSGTVVFLKVDLEKSLERIEHSDRPLAESAITLFHDRISTYEEAPIHVDIGDNLPEEIANIIVEKIG